MVMARSLQPLMAMSESVLSWHLWPVLQSDSMLIPWAMLPLKGTYHHACLSPRAMVNGYIQAHAAAKGKVCILVFLKSGLCYLWLVLPLEVTWTTIVCCGLCCYWGPSWLQWPVLLCKAMVMPYHGAAAESHVWICSWVYADICGQKAGRMSVVYAEVWSLVDGHDTICVRGLGLCLGSWSLLQMRALFKVCADMKTHIHHAPSDQREQISYVCSDNDDCRNMA